MVMHTHNETTREVCPDQYCLDGGFIFCCPRFDKEPQYHNTICPVYMDWQRTTGKYRNRGVCVDAVVLDGSSKKVLLVKRGKPPFEGAWALPGGHVGWDESTVDACCRELQEETGLHMQHAVLIGVYSRPERDPKQNISIAYLVYAGGTLKAGDDAAEAEFRGSFEDPLAFDHSRILEDAWRVYHGQPDNAWTEYIASRAGEFLARQDDDPWRNKQERRGE